MKRVAWFVAVAVAGVAIAVMVSMGFEWAPAVIVGLFGFVAVIVVAGLDLGVRAMLPLLQAARRSGTRSEVSTLSWGLRGSAGISRSALARMRTVSIDALTEAGVHVTTPEGQQRSEELLGSRWTRFLLGYDGDPTPRDAQRAIAGLESLEQTYDRSTSPVDASQRGESHG